MKKLPKTILILMASLSLGLLLIQTLGQASAASAKRAGGEEEEESEVSGKPSVELLLPVMNPERGRKLFASKGCVVCHSIHGVGGTDAPSLDWSTMKGPMNPFDFSARMWHGAPEMIAMQQHELGHQIQFTGEELADIIAFAHSPAEQRKFSKKDIPANIRKLMEHDKD
jgi:cytochrome c